MRKAMDARATMGVDAFVCVSRRWVLEVCSATLKVSCLGLAGETLTAPVGVLGAILERPLISPDGGGKGCGSGKGVGGECASGCLWRLVLEWNVGGGGCIDQSMSYVSGLLEFCMSVMTVVVTGPALDGKRVVRRPYCIHAHTLAALRAMMTRSVMMNAANGELVISRGDGAIVDDRGVAVAIRVWPTGALAERTVTWRREVASAGSSAKVCIRACTLACSSEVVARMVALTRTDAALTVSVTMVALMISSMARRVRKASVSKVDTSLSIRKLCRTVRRSCC